MLASFSPRGKGVNNYSLESAAKQMSLLCKMKLMFSIIFAISCATRQTETEDVYRHLRVLLFLQLVKATKINVSGV